ncbi:MAG TPA: hypothetical protein PKB07_22730 [Flavilitoribacter sp.]|nr:hypothetical protein [Flavilitoribacter sp.]
MILTHHAKAGENGTENEEDCGTDVIAIVEEEDDDGKIFQANYMASFYSYKHIASITHVHKKSGDFLDGAYFHDGNMVLVERCTEELIWQVVVDLIQLGEFGMVFKKI